MRTPPGLTAVEIVLIAQAEAAGAGLDGDIGIERHVGGPAQVLALIDPIGEVVDPIGPPPS